MHPLAGDLSGLKDSEIETKINDLTRRYFMSHNFELQNQVGMLLETYKQEMANRRRIEWEKMQENRNKDLDKLIKVD